MKSSNLSINLKEILKEVTAVFLDKDTVGMALKKLQEKRLDPRIIYFYVVDDGGRLKGVIPTRRLLLCDGNVKVSEIMETSVIKLFDHQILKDAIGFFSTYNLLAIPVVDKDEKLLGVVDVDMYIQESFDIADARHRSDIFQLIGFSLEDEKIISVKRNYRLRMPWIFCNMFSGILCAIISRFNEEVLSSAIILAMFFPLVLTLSESVSMQSMTHALQFIRRPKIKMDAVIKTAIKEGRIVVLIGISSGIIIGFVSLLWKDGPMPSLVIGSGIIISVAISGLFGLIFPILIHKTKLDPKVASGPVVLMLADVLTTAIYLGLASWWLI